MRWLPIDAADPPARRPDEAGGEIGARRCRPRARRPGASRSRGDAAQRLGHPASPGAGGRPVMRCTCHSRGATARRCVCRPAAGRGDGRARASAAWSRPKPKANSPPRRRRAARGRPAPAACRGRPGRRPARPAPGRGAARPAQRPRRGARASSSAGQWRGRLRRRRDHSSALLSRRLRPASRLRPRPARPPLRLRAIGRGADLAIGEGRGVSLAPGGTGGGAWSAARPRHRAPGRSRAPGTAW